MKFATVLIVIAAMLGFHAPAAHAGQLSGEGITVTWDESKLLLPPKFSYLAACGRLKFGYVSNSPTVLKSVQVTFRNPAGGKSTEFLNDVKPGATGSVTLQTCGQNHQAWVGPISVELAVSQDGIKFNKYGPAGLTVSQAPFQPLIDVVDLPCFIEDRADYCRTGNVIRLRNAESWTVGDNSWFALVNKNGDVDFSYADDDAFWFVDPSVPGTVYLRPKNSQFKPGKYIVIAGGEREPSWRCSREYSEFVCRWDDGWKSAVGYTFNWTGEQIRNVKKMKRSELRQFSL